MRTFDKSHYCTGLTMKSIKRTQFSFNDWRGYEQQNRSRFTQDSRVMTYHLYHWLKELVTISSKTAVLAKFNLYILINVTKSLSNGSHRA